MWAFCLLAAGVGIAVWIVVLIHAAVFRPQTVGLFDRLPGKPEDLVLTLPSGKVELPRAGMTVLGYLFVVLLASVATRLTSTMVTHGVSLLRTERKVEPADADSAPPPPAPGIPR